MISKGALIRVLIQHSSHVFSQLPADNNSAKLKDRKEQFLEQLAERYSRQDNLDKS